MGADFIFVHRPKDCLSDFIYVKAMFLKASQNGQHDHITNAEVLYICIFAVLAKWKKGF